MVPVVVLLLLLLTKATTININTPAPTAHTHGSAYQVCVSDRAVVVVVDEVMALSCAHARAVVTVNTHIKKACLKNWALIKFFNFFTFWVKKYLFEKPFFVEPGLVFINTLGLICYYKILRLKVKENSCVMDALFLRKIVNKQVFVSFYTSKLKQVAILKNDVNTFMSYLHHFNSLYL